MESKAAISSWSKEKLEDQYLRLYDDYLTLKKHACKQEERIKKMATKILRLASDKKDSEPGGVWKEDYQEQIETLERKNSALTRKLALVQNQLNVQKQRVGSVPLSARKSSSANIQTTNRNSYTEEKPMNNLSSIQTLRFQNSALEKTVQKLSEQLKERDEIIIQLKDELKIKEKTHTNDLFALGEQVTSKQRLALQENIDLIRTQRELREKQLLITTLEARVREAESNYEVTKSTNRQLVSEVERLTRESSQLEQKLFRLESDSNSASKLQLKILELQYAYDDAKRENEVLKESNEKLVANAFSTKLDQNWILKEQKLRAQIDHLEIMVHNLQQQIKEQEEEKAKHRHHQQQQQPSNQFVEEHIISNTNQSNTLESVPIRQDNKSNSYEQPTATHLFAQITGFDVEELEDAIIMLRERKSKSQSTDRNLNYAEKHPPEQNKDSLKQLNEAEALHADTITELEKTRKLLSVQYKINKDYQAEIKELTERLTDLKAESEQRLHEYAKLLDIRAVRIQQLEKQIQDLAYGTNKRKALNNDQLSSGILSTENALQPGESLIELHMGQLNVTTSILQKLQMTDSVVEQSIRLFLTWDFYDFETQATPIIVDNSVDLNMTVQYPVEVNDVLMNYFLKEPCTIEMHQVADSSYRTIAVGKLDFSQLFTAKDEGLETFGQGTVIRRQSHLDLFLIPVVGNQNDNKQKEKGDNKTKLGTLDYWIRLCSPMRDSIKLYKERFQQLPGSNMFNKSLHQDIISGNRSVYNTLVIEIRKISNLVNSRPDHQPPSSYFVYQFYDKPEYDSNIIKENSSPVFNDCHSIDLQMDPELDSYLRTESLKIYILDSSAPEPEASCLGVAVVPLVGLIHKKQEIDGVYEIFPPAILLKQQLNQHEKFNEMKDISDKRGLVYLKMYWKQPYTTESKQVVVCSQPDTEISKDLEIEPVKQTAEKPYKIQGQSEEEVYSSTLSNVAFTNPPDKFSSKQRTHENLLQPSTSKKSQVDVDLDPVKEELIEKVTRVKVNQKPYKIQGQSEEEVYSSTLSNVAFTNPPDKFSSKQRTHENLLQPSTSKKSQVDVDLDPVKEELIEKVTRVKVNQTSNQSNDPSVHEQQSGKVFSTQSESRTTRSKPMVPTPHPRTRLTEIHDTKEDTLNLTTKSGFNESGLQVILKKPIHNDLDTRNSKQITPTTTPTPTVQSSIDDNHVKIELHGLQLTNLSKIPNNQIPTQVFVEYSFLGYKEPFETGSYRLNEWMDDNRKILKANFYYSKTFSVDFTDNYEQRQYLASLLLPEDPNNGRIVFIVVAEPSTMQSGECEELGYVVINIRKMVKDNLLYDHAFIPITSARVVGGETENIQEIGKLCVSLHCLPALRAIIAEMPDIQLAI
ncbi:unnamed protein product [Heterobilharzia americana]|nr:unnamed protein product [Heterobilharzia americana]